MTEGDVLDLVQAAMWMVVVGAGPVVGAAMAMGQSAMGVAVIRQLLLSAAMCVVAAWLGRLLYRTERAAEAITK